MTSRAAATQLALLLFLGWFNVLLQPCSAATASPCTNCPDTVDQGACVTQADNTCAVASAALAKPDVSGRAAPPAVLLALLPPPVLQYPDCRDRLIDNPASLPGSDPPHRIRYCSYQI